MKTFKKIIKYLSITVIVLLVLLVSVPFIFKGKIIEYAKKEINNNLNAKVDFGEIELGIFSTFPNLNLCLNDLIIIGVEVFEKDTLITFKKFETELDLFSVFGDVIKIKGIGIHNPDLKVKVLKDGRANWDIMKTSAETTGESDTSATHFSLALDNFFIRNGKVVYDDMSLGVVTSLENLSFSLKGDLTDIFTSLSITADADSFTLGYEGVNYINKTGVKINAELDADLEKSKYTFRNNSVILNELELALEGTVEMPGDDILLGLKFNALKTDFRNILSMLPAVYMNDFKSVTTTGKIEFGGSVNGTYNDSLMPGFDIKLVVENGSFKYPSLPSSVENINLSLAVSNKDGEPDNTIIDIEKFHAELGGSPFDMKLHVSTPVSDPNLSGMVKGKLSLASVKSFMPVQDAALSGLVDADVDFAGRMSQIEQEKYEDFKATGNIALTDVQYTSSELKLPVKISNAAMTVTPKFFELNSFNMAMGSSDFSLNGKIENFLAYVFRDELLKGIFNFNSNMLNVNQMMGESSETSASQVPADTASLTAFIVPENIDFTLNTSLTKVLYDTYDIQNIKGSIVVKDGKVGLDGVNMQMLDGTMQMNGFYSTKNTNKPDVDFGMDMKDINVEKLYASSATIQKIAPVAGSCKGNVSVNLGFNGKLDNTMSPDMKTINGSGLINTKSLELSGSEALDKLSQLIKSDKYKKLALQNMSLKFKIVNGNIEVEPVIIKAGKSDFEFGGKQGIDLIADYFMNFKIPSSELGSAANDVMNNLSSQAGNLGIDIKVPEYFDIKGIITGLVSKPEIKFNLKDQGKSAVENVKEQVVERINEEVDKAKAEAIKKAREQADKLMKEADSKCEKIMAAANDAAKQINDAAKTAAGNVRTEGNNQADKLLKEAKAKGPIAEKLAKEPAQKLRDEAEKKAQEIEKKAKQESENKLQQAKQETDKIKTAAKQEGDKLIEEASKK